jgi:putative PIN family toxin of toxin-antitoxin system
LSAAIRPASTPSLAVEKALANDKVLVSLETWAELVDVLMRGKFDRYQAIAVRQRFLIELEPLVETISVRSSLEICRHPKDDKFLELALDGQADVIVTGDNDLLTLHPFRGIAILKPADYLAS